MCHVRSLFGRRNSEITKPVLVREEVSKVRKRRRNARIDETMSTMTPPYSETMVHQCIMMFSAWSSAVEALVVFQNTSRAGFET